MTIFLEIVFEIVFDFCGTRRARSVLESSRGGGGAPIEIVHGTDTAISMDHVRL